VGTRLQTWWMGVRDSLWLLPALLTLAGFLLSMVTLWIDAWIELDDRDQMVWVFGGGSDGARGVLSAIAGSLMTVTGTVFSITIVALQLASSQFTPRVLRAFIKDRANQVVLGVLIGTFTYSLLVLRAVRGADDGRASFIPAISVSVAVVLALLCVSLIIFFIHHVARSIQASAIIDRAANDTRTLVNRLFPEQIGEPASEAVPPPVLPAGDPGTVATEGGGYLEAIDADALFDLAEEQRLVLRMEPLIGGFILPGAPLVSVWPAEAAEEATEKVRRAFVLGPERTLQQDVELGLRQLADIALRALSPGVNDPTTADICIDRLAEVLTLLGSRSMPDEARMGEDGQVRFLARRTTFDRAVGISFDQIRHYGAADATVMAHLLRKLGEIAALVPASRHPPLIGQSRAVLRAAREKIEDPDDLAAVEEAGTWVMRAVATAAARDGRRE
jgi:uncharacterized membrane protein